MNGNVRNSFYRGTKDFVQIGSNRTEKDVARITNNSGSFKIIGIAELSNGTASAGNTTEVDQWKISMDGLNIGFLYRSTLLSG